jgi:hypothetical protein
MFGYILIQLICISFVICQDTCQKIFYIDPNSALQIILNDALCYTSASGIKSLTIASSQPMETVLPCQTCSTYNGKVVCINTDYTFTGTQITLPSYDMTRTINMPSSTVLQNLSDQNNTITVFKTGGTPPLSPGAIVGIVFGCIFFVGMIVYAFYYFKYS